MQANIKIPSAVYAALEDRAKMARITVEAMLERIISDHVASFSSSGSDVISAPLVSRGRFEHINSHPRFSALVTNAELEYQVQPSKGSRPFGPEEVAHLDQEDDYR